MSKQRRAAIDIFDDSLCTSERKPDVEEKELSPLNVLIFTTDVHAGGIKASTLRLKEMLKGGVSGVSILSYEPSEAAGPADYSLGLPLVREFELKPSWHYDIRRAMGMVVAVLRFRRLVKKNSFDVVISMSYGPSIVALISKRLGLKFKLIVSERQDPSRDLSAGWRKSLVRRLCGWMYRGSDLYHCNSPVAAKRAPLLFGVSPERTLYIPNGYDFAMLDERAAAPIVASVPGPYVVSCGRLNEQKGQHIAIGIFKRMVDLGYSGVLLFIGEGSLEASLRAQAAASGISERVIFLGGVENAIPYFRGSDLVLVTSLWEGFANVPVEAASIGGRVISTRWSGAEEVLQTSADYFSADLELLNNGNEHALLLAAREAMSALTSLPRSFDVESLRMQYGHVETARKFIVAIEGLQ